jgi:sensor domain CHASE-containing protein
MAVAIVGAVIAVIVAIALLSRMQSNRKKEAMADLQQEIEQTHVPDILELVNEEIDDAGIRDLPGAEDLDPTVLLRVWKRDGAGCRGAGGEFQVAGGIAPSEATEVDVTFTCGEEGE